MRLKLDENLGQLAASLLRHAGHDVATVVEQRLSAAPDDQVISTASGEARCLVTLDLEFANPLVFRPADHRGIAVLRLPARPTPDDLASTIRTLIGGLATGRIDRRLWIVERGRIREYQPEGGVEREGG